MAWYFYWRHVLAPHAKFSSHCTISEPVYYPLSKILSYRSDHRSPCVLSRLLRKGKNLAQNKADTLEWVIWILFHSRAKFISADSSCWCPVDVHRFEPSLRHGWVWTYWAGYSFVDRVYYDPPILLQSRPNWRYSCDDDLFLYALLGRFRALWFRTCGADDRDTL